VESATAVISACLPTLPPLFNGWSPENILGSWRSLISRRLSSSSGKVSPRSSKERSFEGAHPYLSSTQLNGDVTRRAALENYVEAIPMEGLKPGGDPKNGEILVQKSFSHV